MKNVELKLISELMKNSRRSDRDLAKAIGTSQPTVTRTRTRLEKQGYIKEYTMIPDFQKLGFEIMALTFVKYTKELTEKEYEKVKQTAKECEKNYPTAVLMAVTGTGLSYDRVFISFHENYASVMKMMRTVKQLPFRAVANVENFLVSLTGGDHYQLCTLSVIANYLLTMMKKSAQNYMKDLLDSIHGTKF